MSTRARRSGQQAEPLAGTAHDALTYALVPTASPTKAPSPATSAVTGAAASTADSTVPKRTRGGRVKV